ncbi:MAG: hypothetical protein PF694_01115 [Bacteroidetes bacterium]|jgi:hypothetical protein|nr:hypothetical protein [Bacteroidota bacterium]
MKATTILIIAIFQVLGFNFMQAQAAQVVTGFQGTTENYIDDIPFDTEKLFRNYQDSIFNMQHMDAEAYVDDIPFETAEVAAEAIAEQAMQVDFAMQKEQQIDDIPFDTQKIAQSSFGFMLEHNRLERMSK